MYSNNTGNSTGFNPPMTCLKFGMVSSIFFFVTGLILIVVGVVSCDNSDMQACCPQDTTCECNSNSCPPDSNEYVHEPCEDASSSRELPHVVMEVWEIGIVLKLIVVVQIHLVRS